MATIDVTDSGIVYRNAQPHLRSRHAYFPTVAELPLGELFAAFDVGSAFEAVDVRSFCCRSVDGGRTWSEPTMIFAPDERARAGSTTCRVGQVAPGELLAWACVFDRSREEEGLANPQTNGFVDTDFLTLRSTDGGRSWSPPQPAELPVEWRGFEACASPYPLGDGRLLVATSAWANWEGGASPWRQDGLAFASSDSGATWSELIYVFRSEDESVASFEQHLARLSDGRTIGVCWAYDHQQQKSLRNRIAISVDGRTFGPPRETPLQGETCRLLGLPDNHILAVYRRVDKPGLWAQVALVDGERWIPQGDAILWSGGAAYGADGDATHVTTRMSTLRFGCPAITLTQSGEALVVFWCVEDCVSVIRWFKVKTTL